MLVKCFRTEAYRSNLTDPIELAIRIHIILADGTIIKIQHKVRELGDTAWSGMNWQSNAGLFQ